MLCSILELRTNILDRHSRAATLDDEEWLYEPVRYAGTVGRKPRTVTCHKILHVAVLRHLIKLFPTAEDASKPRFIVRFRPIRTSITFFWPFLSQKYKKRRDVSMRYFYLGLLGLMLALASFRPITGILRKYHFRNPLSAGGSSILLQNSTKLLAQDHRYNSDTSTHDRRNVYGLCQCRHGC